MVNLDNQSFPFNYLYISLVKSNWAKNDIHIYFFYIIDTF